MPKKTQDEWGTAPKALAILQEVNQRDIHKGYLYVLWRSGKLDRRAIDGRTYEYNLTQARNIHIIEKKGSGRKPTKTDTQTP